MKTESKVYRCKSSKQKDFILSKKIEYIDVYENKEGITTWLFLKCDELDKVLTQWSNNNPNKRN
jgi:hypothetical protein